MPSLRQTGDSQLLLADDHLVIDSPYDPEQVADTKRIPGARWDRVARVWRIPMTSVAAARDFATRWDLWIDPAILTFTLPTSTAPATGEGTVTYLPDDHELEISFPFDSLKVESVKRLPNARFIPDTKTFRIPAGMVREVCDWAQIFHCRPSREVLALRDDLITSEQTMREASRAEDADISIPGLQCDLRPFQRAGVAYILHTRRCFVADDMGLGKTVMSLAAVEAADEYPVVVVCPATLTHNWRAEAHRWLPHRSVVLLEGMPKPDLVDEIKSALLLDPHVGSNGLKEREEVLPRTEVPAVDGHFSTVPLSAVGASGVDLAAEGLLDPSQDLVVGVADVQTPVAGETGEGALAVDEPGNVGTISDLSRGREVSLGPSLAAEGDVDVTSLSGVVEAGGTEPNGSGDLGQSEPLKVQLNASRFDLGRDLPLLRHADILVVNYATLNAWRDVLIAVKPHAFILDESHMCKTPTAQRTKAAIKIAKAVPKNGLVLCLTGTPVTNRPAEYASQLEILDRLRDFGGRWAFYKRYANAFRDRFGQWHIDGASHLDELNDRLRASCYIRRTKDQVMSELPPVEHAPLYVAGSTKAMREYTRAQRDIATYVANRAATVAEELGTNPRSAAVRARLAAEANEFLVQISHLRRLAALAKLDAVTEWVDAHIDAGEKVVLAAHHRDVVDALAEKYGGLKIQGGQDPDEIEAHKSRFQNEPVGTAPVIVLSIQAAKTGHTLTAAQNICFVELPWTPADLDQTTARCHRIGQRGSVTATYLLAEGTVDERIYELIASKRAIVEMAIDGRSEDVGSVVGAADLMLSFLS